MGLCGISSGSPGWNLGSSRAQVPGSGHQLRMWLWQGSPGTAGHGPLSPKRSIPKGLRGCQDWDIHVIPSPNLEQTQPAPTAESEL